MRPIGFSTGALAYSNYRQGLSMMRGRHLQAVELSALRENELVPLLNDLDSLDLHQFSYVSIHAPSEFSAAQETTIRDLLKGQLRRGWPIVMHPDTIHDFELWRDFGPLLAIENMDKRKPIGRTAHQLASIFEKLPNASLCFDIGHARQVDPTMTEAYLILRQFGRRLRQVHVSEVNTRSKHDVLSYASILAFQEVADLIPLEVPLILETPLTESQMQSEIEKVDSALPVEHNVAVA
jgi:xylose isomerase-like TIM barrel protein